MIDLVKKKNVKNIHPFFLVDSNDPHTIQRESIHRGLSEEDGGDIAFVDETFISAHWDATLLSFRLVVSCKQGIDWQLVFPTRCY